MNFTRAEAGGRERPTLFCLHYLGGSAGEWTHVAQRLGTHVRVVALDLPGFGDAAHVPGYHVAEMAQWVAQAVRREAPRRWFVAGHSMGAKVAAVLARDAENGAPGLTGLDGIILLAGSPPSPEPMPDEQREKMLGWFAGDAQRKRDQAREYIAANAGPALHEHDALTAAADALRMNRVAWVHWLEHGSREDWSDRVGLLRTPALIISGADDENLGPAAQRDVMAPHFAHARSATLPDTRHLLPLERPGDIARLIGEHVVRVGRDRDTLSVTQAYGDLIDSVRVSSRTREVLRRRATPDDPRAYVPAALDARAFAILRALVARVVPQTGSQTIDLAARIDAQLASGAGDGWRFAELPPDREAYVAALLTAGDAALERYTRDASELDDAQVDDLLTAMAAGRLDSPAANGAPAAQRLTSGQMRSWFEDLRADAVRLYMAHPATLARIGYSGIANGGDAEPKSGFVRIGIGEREPWEPVSVPETTS